jgi:hypothetical protein
MSIFSLLEYVSTAAGYILPFDEIQFRFHHLFTAKKQEIMGKDAIYPDA